MLSLLTAGSACTPGPVVTYSRCPSRNVWDVFVLLSYRMQVQISNFIAKFFPERHIPSQVDESHLDLLVLRVGAGTQHIPNRACGLARCLSIEAQQAER